MGKKITILLLSLLLLASLGLAIKEIYSALHPTKDPEVIADLCYGKNGHTDCLVYVKEDGKYYVRPAFTVSRNEPIELQTVETAEAV